MGEKETAIEIHCDAGKILDKAGSRAQIGVCGFLRRRITEHTKNAEYQQGVDVPWVSSKSPRVSTSSFAGEIQALFYGFDMERMLEGLLEELMFWNVGVEIPTYVRSDNSDAVYRADSVNTVTDVDV